MANVTFKLISLVGQSVYGDRPFGLALADQSKLFDCLWQVEEVTTKVKGLLLCSHRSNFPPQLLPKATWLAGCLTPKELEGDPRLVFGPTPNSYIQWELDAEQKLLHVHVEKNYAGSITNAPTAGIAETSGRAVITSVRSPYTVPMDELRPSPKVVSRINALARVHLRTIEEEETLPIWYTLFVEGVLRQKWGASNAARLMWMFHPSAEGWMRYIQPPRPDLPVTFDHPYMMGAGRRDRRGRPTGPLVVITRSEEGFYSAMSIRRPE